MTGYRYTASEVDAIIERNREAAKGPAAIGLALAALSGFVAATILFGGALAMGWLP